MTTLRLILSDQLSHSLSSLEDAKDNDIILMCEVIEEATYVKYHPKKIALIFASMRHFADELRQQGKNVRYVVLDDPQNSGTLEGEVKRAIDENKVQNIVVTEPGEYRILQKFSSWEQGLGLSMEIRPDNRFLCQLDELKKWAKEKKQLRMEYFYREMRKRYNILIEKDGKPTGGEWNYDKENRKSPPKGSSSPERISHPKVNWES